MYQTVEQIREYLGYLITPSGDYSDQTLEALSKKTTSIINGYLGQSIEYSETSEKIIAIPHLASGFTVTLNRRFLVDLNKFEIEYGYNIDNYVFASGDYFIDRELGLLETKEGACPSFLFEEERNDKYLADVAYTAGYTSEELPQDFVDAFYMVYEQVFGNYNWKANPDDISGASNKVKRYRTLNEDVTFEEKSPLDKAADELLNEAVTNILDNYRMPTQGIGRFM